MAKRSEAKREQKNTKIDIEHTHRYIRTRYSSACLFTNFTLNSSNLVTVKKLNDLTSYDCIIFCWRCRTSLCHFYPPLLHRVRSHSACFLQSLLVCAFDVVARLFCFVTSSPRLQLYRYRRSCCRRRFSISKFHL